MKINFLSVRLIRNTILAAIFVFGSLPVTVFAYDEDFYQSNNILYYDPRARNACSTAGYSRPTDIPSLEGNENAEKIWNFLIDTGLSEEQTAGVMGSIQQESGYNPAQEENPASYNTHTMRPVGYGLVQWTAERRIALEAAASEKNVAVSDLGFQLAYMVDESKSRRITERVAGQGYGATGDNEWETLKKMKTIQDATIFFHSSFEVSADSPEKVLATRGVYAQNAYDTFKGTRAAPPPGSGPSSSIGGTPTTNTGSSSSSGGNSCTPAVGGGDLTQTLLSYAWPEYHEPPFVTMMPAYEAAVKKAQADGRGVGGIQYPGIDCAGFVSLLLVDSGFDPEYNSRGTYAVVDPIGNGGSGTGNDIPIGDPVTGEAIARRWMEANWTSLGKGGEINVADLKPGDAAVTRQGSGEHIFLYVGEIEGFGNVFASSSLDTRAPMAAGTYENAVDNSYDWFGKR